MDGSIEILVFNKPSPNTIVIDYQDFESLPNFIKQKKDIEEFLFNGTEMLKLLNNRFATRRNLKDLKDILFNYFGAEMKEIQPVRIYIDEYKTVFIWYSLFKIKVFVDYD